MPTQSPHRQLPLTQGSRRPRHRRARRCQGRSVTINGHDTRYHPKIVAALPAVAPYYNAGAVAGDGFPDVLMGQFAIHPIEHATWLTRVLDMAWKAQNEPSYHQMREVANPGLELRLPHALGGRPFRALPGQQFAEGVAPGFGAAAKSMPGDQRDLGNMLRHFMTEAYIADSLPGFDGNRTDRTEIARRARRFHRRHHPGDRLRRADPLHLRDLPARLSRMIRRRSSRWSGSKGTLTPRPRLNTLPRGRSAVAEDLDLWLRRRRLQGRAEDHRLRLQQCRQQRHVLCYWRHRHNSDRERRLVGQRDRQRRREDRRAHRQDQPWLLARSWPMRETTHSRARRRQLHQRTASWTACVSMRWA